MIKKLVVLLACFGLVHLSACTSNDQKSDAEVTSDFDSADLEKLDGEESMDMAGDNSLGSDQLPEDALGETTTTTTETTTTSTDVDMDAPAPEVATSESLPADPFAEQQTVESTPEPTMESTTVVDSSPMEPESTTVVESTTSTRSETTSSYSSSDEEKPKKANVPLQKVATAPWKVGKVWYNTVYFARPGDSLSSISTMIYGKGNKVSEIKKGNPTFQGRGVKPGDKVYYNSPHRSDDSGRLLTYYEDNGIAPETYVAKEGDDMKKLSKDLLGYKDAWKEVWASNSVDSKGAIAAGTELRYWKGGSVAAAPAAPIHQEIAAAPPVQEMAPPQQEMPMDPMQGDMPPPPQQADNMDMPPPPQDMAGQEMAPPPPPPDMAQEMAPPPPPPPVEAVNPPAPAHHEGGEEVAGIGGMDQDTTLALAVVGLAAAGLAILIVVRKKRRQKELEQHMDNTHVG